MALGAFGSLNKIWKSKSISRKNQVPPVRGDHTFTDALQRGDMDCQATRFGRARGCTLQNAEEHDEFGR